MTGSTGNPEVPPHGAVLAILNGFQASQIVSCVARLGIPDLVARRPKASGELARETNTDAAALYRLLRASASLGVLAEDAEGRFGQTPMSETLRSDTSPGLRGFASFLTDSWHIRSWEQLRYAVETGAPAADHVLGQPLFDYFARHPETSVNFNDGMTNLSTIESAAAAEAYDFSELGSLCDVGGGHGLLLATILRRNPGLHGVLLDIPYVIEGTKKAGHWAGLESRVRMEAGDMFAGVPAGLDAYVMKYIIHDWSDEKCAQLLRHCRRSVNPGGRLLVIDQLVPPGNTFSPTKLLDIQMLVFLTGKERTEEQFRQLFAAAGWRLTRVVPTGTPMCVLEGKAA